MHKSVQALEADIRAWIETWNQNPRPFAWTKTAAEILDSWQNISRRFPAWHTRPPKTSLGPRRDARQGSLAPCAQPLLNHEQPQTPGSGRTPPDPDKINPDRIRAGQGPFSQVVAGVGFEPT